MIEPPHALNAATFFIDRHVAEGRGDRIAFRFRGRSLTYAEVAAGVEATGGELARRGLEPGDRVLLALSDTPAFVTAFWAVVRGGAVAVPVNTLMTAGEYEFLLNDSHARLAVVAPEVASHVAAARERCPWLREVIVAGDELVAEPGGRSVVAPTGSEDVMYWGYTSGSTGAPKAAVHTHGHFVAAAALVGRGVFDLGPEDRTFSASKMSFAFGLGNTLYFPALAAGSAVLVSERLTPERAFEVIAAERPTVFFAVPTLYARMLALEAPRRYDLSSLRFCVSSGEALPPTLFDRWSERFGLELLDVVGSTENLHDFIANRPGDTCRGSAGRLVPGFHARLEDEDGRPVSPGAVGHLLIRGETTAPYYWNRPEHTRQTMLGPWLRTGDMFARDEAGRFYFVGRGDDMLKVGGQWVSPAEVEAHLGEHPVVLEAAVVGRPDADGLAHAHAAVVLKEGTEVAETMVEELRGFLAGRLPAYKVPRTIEIVQELPKTATGKIQRYRLRAG